MASKKKIRRLDDASRRRFIAFVRAEIAELAAESAFAIALGSCSRVVEETLAGEREPASYPKTEAEVEGDQDEHTHEDSSPCARLYPDSLSARVRLLSAAGPDDPPTVLDYGWQRRVGLLCSHPTKTTGRPCRRPATRGSRCKTHSEKAPDVGERFPESAKWL